MILSIAACCVAFAACAPPPTYRVPVPPVASPRPSSAPVAPPAPEPAPQGLPNEAKIREQDLRSKTAPTLPAKSAKEPTRQASVTEPRGSESSPPLADDSSLLAKITPGTSAQRAASLRLTEEGRRILDAGDPARSLTRLEKTIVIDSTNPYGYYYLAKAQHRLGRHKESLNFLDVAESRLGAEPFWLSEIHALRGENYHAQGQPQRAEASYNQALRLNSGNRTAADGLARVQGDPPAAQPATK
ncbi:MAG: tetratricopeptide repeat protein [Deltaproteobacteria bacterium]|nr:tetratricopeptide repeat protein [Deltaproteobacteria bacterium]